MPEQTERPDEPLPFRAEYEVGVQEGGNPDDWEFYHPLAKSTEEAKRKAREMAEGDGMMDPMVYQASGPYEPDDPIRVGEEMIDEVFG